MNMRTVNRIKQDLRSALGNLEWLREGAEREDRPGAWSNSVTTSEMHIRETRQELMRIAGANARWSALASQTPQIEIFTSIADSALELVDTIDAALDGKEWEIAHTRLSYPAELIAWIMKEKIARDPQHAVNVLNLSGGRAESWSNRRFAVWAKTYRWYRRKGHKKAEAVQYARSYANKVMLGQD